MPITFTCECGQTMQAREEDAGQRTRCPGCGMELTVPPSGEAIQAVPPSPGRASYEGITRSAPPPERHEGPPTTSGKAIAAFVLGLLSLCLTVFTAIPAIVLGIVSLVNISRSGGRLKGQGLAIAGIALGTLGGLILGPILILGGLLIPSVQKVREAAGRAHSSNNLRQLALALHNYESDNKTMPPAAIYGRDGRPLLSWRVAILPYIEQENLYRQFKLDEPWDSPHNSKLLSQMPKTYAHPSPRAAAPPGHTYYRAITGPGTAFEGTRGLSLSRDFMEKGPGNTILVAEAADAVPWTKPDELVYQPGLPLPRLGDHYYSGSLIALDDGSVRTLPKDTTEAALRDAILRTRPPR